LRLEVTAGLFFAGAAAFFTPGFAAVFDAAARGAGFLAAGFAAGFEPDAANEAAPRHTSKVASFPVIIANAFNFLRNPWIWSSFNFNSV
jgi:hypothetical protein